MSTARENLDRLKKELRSIQKVKWDEILFPKPKPPVSLPLKETTLFCDLVNYGISEENAFNLIRDIDYNELTYKIIEYQNLAKGNKAKKIKTLPCSMLEFLQGKHDVSKQPGN